MLLSRVNVSSRVYFSFSSRSEANPLASSRARTQRKRKGQQRARHVARACDLAGRSDQYLAIPKVERQSVAGSQINSASALGSPESNRPTLHARVWLLMLFKGTDRDLAINIHRPRSIINNAARAFKGHHIVQLEPCSSRYTYLERERVFQAERPCEILRS